MNRDQARHTTALYIGRAHRVTWTFGCNHDHIEISARFDLAEVNIESVGKTKRRALLKIRCDLITV